MTHDVSVNSRLELVLRGGEPGGGRSRLVSDLDAAVRRKIARNEEKYPSEVAGEFDDVVRCADVRAGDWTADRP